MAKDKTTSQRKIDHLDLAASSAIPPSQIDPRFYYEPLLGSAEEVDLSTTFLDHEMNYPVWVSSMTGGTVEAQTINRHLAQLCAAYGLGMGLGSCRVLLDNQDRLSDFDMRPIIGPDRPLYANMGIAQVEQLADRGELERLNEVISLLDADGLFIHINPLQEWAQDEGDRLHRPPIDVVHEALEVLTKRVIVKEVGQGMGPQSLEALLDSTVDGIEFAAAGGTNFTRLELLRARGEMQYKDHLSAVGHTVSEMVHWTNAYRRRTQRSKQLILSGGIRNYLDGYHVLSLSEMPSIYGMAGALLPHARQDLDRLKTFFEQQMEGLTMATAYLRLRS